MKTLKFIILFLLILTSKALAEEPAWEMVSMNPPRGTVWNYSVSDDGKIFIGSEGGAFSSYDNGKSWNKLLDGYCVPIVISKRGNLLSRRNDLKAWKSAVWVSYDLGIKWKELLSNCNWISVDNEKTLLSIYDADSTNKLYANFYLSKDDTNWEKIGTIPDSLIQWSLAARTYFKDSLIFQSVSDYDYHVYLAASFDLGKNWKKIKLPYSIHNMYIKSNEIFYVATENGIYCSRDAGNNWEQLWLQNIAVYGLYFVNDEIIFAGIKKGGIVYTLNGGKDWLYPEMNDEFNNTNNISQAFNYDKNDHIYSSPYQNGIYKSENLGKNWYERNNGFSALQPRDIVFSDSNIYISCWGIFKSTNEGKTFDYLGMKAYDLSAVGVNSKGFIFVGDYGTGSSQKGVYRSTDGGNTWESKQSFVAVLGIVINSKDMLFISPGYGSKDNGETWRDLGIEASYIAINDEDHIFGFNSGNIYRSINDGVTWERVAKTEVDPTYTETGGKIIFNNKTKTAAYYNLMTTDNGRTWFSQKEWGTELGTTKSINYAVDSLGCWVRNWNWVNENYEYSLYRTCDNGMTWQMMDTTGLNRKDFQTIGCSPDGHIYVFGSTGGLYRSRDRFVSVEENMKINPNNFSQPASDFLEIEINEYDFYRRDNSIKIYNILGNCVLTDSFNNNHDFGKTTKQLNISTLSPGLYFVKVGDKVSKFVKI